MTDSVWNIVLIVLITLAAVGAIALISFIDMGLMGGMVGGMMSCGVGMAGGWLVGFLLIAVIAGAVILLLRHRPQH
jgi:biotin transporter BioY